MICYRDRTYCSGSRTVCNNTECRRFLKKEEEDHAIRLDLPIAFSDLHTNCRDIVKIND